MENDSLSRLQQRRSAKAVKESYEDYDLHQEEIHPPAPHGNPAILLMGLTGAGKSTLISQLTDETVKIGHSLESCTTDVYGHAIRGRNGETIYLIDTPGFDDTQISMTELLKNIAGTLSYSYKSRQFNLIGLIYLHRITDQRVAGSSLMSLRIFENICGQSNFPSVVLATTMWSLLGNPEAYEKAEGREVTLREKEEFFGRMISGGARVVRLDGTKQSARAIVDDIVANGSQVVTDLQMEMVDEGKTLGETQVGQFLETDTRKTRQRYESRLRNLQQELEEAKAGQEDDLISTISDEQRECEERIRQANLDGEKMAITVDEMMEGGLQWVQDKEKQDEVLRQQVADLEQEVQQLKKDRVRDIERLRHEQRGQSNEYEKVLQKQLRRLKESLNNSSGGLRDDVKWKESQPKLFKWTMGLFARTYPDIRTSHPRRTQTFPAAEPHSQQRAKSSDLPKPRSSKKKPTTHSDRPNPYHELPKVSEESYTNNTATYLPTENMEISQSYHRTVESGMTSHSYHSTGIYQSAGYQLVTPPLGPPRTTPTGEHIVALRRVMTQPSHQDYEAEDDSFLR